MKFNASMSSVKVLSYIQPILLNNVQIQKLEALSDCSVCALLWVLSISGYFATDIINFFSLQPNFVPFLSFYFFPSSSC